MDAMDRFRLYGMASPHCENVAPSSPYRISRQIRIQIADFA
jgi:hypothetical protein